MPAAYLPPEYSVDTRDLAEGVWSDILQGFSDATINQTWSFGASLSGGDCLSHCVLRRGQLPVAAAQLRVLRLPVVRTRVAYLAWGPMWQPRGHGAHLEHLRLVMRSLRQEYAVKRRIPLWVLPNIWEFSPLASSVTALLEEEGYSSSPCNQRTFFLNLAPPEDEIRKQFHQKWRNCLNYAQKQGLEIREGSSAELFEAFATVYQDMLRRKQYANPVDIATFGAMRDRQPDTLKPLIILAQAGGKPLAGAVLSTVGDTGIYLLGATNADGLKAKAAYMVQWRAIQWLRGNGFRAYDLGGVDKEKVPETYEFKARICGKNPTDERRVGEFWASEGMVGALAVHLTRRAKDIRRWLRPALPAWLRRGKTHRAKPEEARAPRPGTPPLP